MIKEIQRIRPQRLSNRRPNSGFSDIGSRFVIARKKAHSIFGHDGSNEKLRQERFDGGI